MSNLAMGCGFLLIRQDQFSTKIYVAALFDVLTSLSVIISAA